MGSIGVEELQKMERMPTASPREEKILVLVRLRPLSDKEIVANETADWECINRSTILYRNTLREGCTFPSAYTFDRVFRGDSATRQVYDEGVKEVALSVVSGINSSIFAYGQTSSGKTYTMTGVTEYTVADIFDYIHRHEERAFVLKFSAIEMYNEAIRDLLSKDNTPLRLLDDAEKGTIVEKVTEEILRDWEHLKELLSICEAQRRIGETSLNEKSSRSHQILRLTIESSAREFLGKENSTTLAATVNFIDLAGSERASQALSSGTRLKEGCHINRSLLTLGTVIRKLSKGRQGHVNYRDSKLTRLLQPALGGNARSAIICTLSPARSHVEQTRNTLLFACCAKEVTTKAQVNVVMSDKALVKHLQKEVARLESELRSPAPTSSTCDYAALLRRKDLHIQKMEKEIRELTKQRDLAESRIEDLLLMIGDDQQSGKQAGIDHHPSQQTGDIWDDECSVSESVAEPRYLCGGRKRYNMTQYDGDSGSNAEEPYHLQSSKGHLMSDGTSSIVSIGKKILRSSSGRSLEGCAVEAADDYCREVRCIEMKETSREKKCDPRHESEGVLNLTSSGNGDAAQEASTLANGNGEVSHMQNGFTYNMLEQRLHRVQRTIDTLVSPYHDAPSPQSSVAEMSSSRSMRLNRSWSCRDNLETRSPPFFHKDEQLNNTPPNGLEKKFSGRPQSLRRKLPLLNYGTNAALLSRNGSQSSLGSACTDDLRSESINTPAREDIPSIRNFVAGLEQMAMQEYEKQHAEGQDTESEAGKLDRSLKHVGYGPLESSNDWPLKFERLQRAILELWQTCNVSLVHRTYFFLLFKGDPMDSVYMEVELRRLSFLKDTFSQGDKDVGGGQALTLASSIKALHRERGMLSKLMYKRFSEGERNRLYKKWGIELNSKRRRLQLANRLWSDTKDTNHVTESAAIVAKLVRFVQQGEALKEMFGLSFTPPSSRRKSLGWTYSKSSLM